MDYLNRTSSSRTTADYRNGKNGTNPTLGIDRVFQDQALPPNLVGEELTSSDIAALEAPWIDRQLGRPHSCVESIPSPARNSLATEVAIMPALPFLTSHLALTTCVNIDYGATIPISKRERMASCESSRSTSVRQAAATCSIFRLVATTLFSPTQNCRS